MIPHQTSVPRRGPSSAGDCAQSKRSAAVTELENAVAHFQATLTDEDRRRLKDLKKLPRDPQSIIVFTAELDMQQREKRRGKSIASRLTSFLQIVQQFTPIIDTYIRSNPDISAIIWSSIKLTFIQLSAWATKYSAAMKDLQDLKEKHCKDKKRVKLINELTSYNSMPTFNSMRNKRHMGTAEWCFHTPEYQGWANANKSAILHITGKMIRSCLQQLLASPLIETLDSGAMADLDISLQEAKSSLFSAASLSSLCTTASKNLDDWFIVIDGLDEVDIVRQIGLLKFLRDVLDQLAEPHRIKLLLSSRETSSSDIDRILPQVTRLYTGLKPTSADIRLYAEDIISNKISTNELIVNDPGLEAEIIEAIHRKEKGMFLWVFLTINDICSRKSDKDIRRALQDIPGDLHATFDRTLGRIAAKKNNTAIVQKTFTLIQASFEPLTLDQLREALSVDIGQQTLDRDDLISGVDRLPMCHHSIQKYLLIPSSEDLEEFHLERDKCNRLMGELCVTYISLDNFQRALGFTRKRNTDSPHVIINMGGLAEQTIRTAVGDSIGSLIGRFTREAVGPSHTTSPGKVQWNGSRLSSVPKHNFGPSQSSEQYTFFEYASKHWHKHQLCIDSNDNEATWRLLGQILRRPHQYSQGDPWFQPAWKKAVSETIGNDVLFFGPGFDSYRETAVSLETDENGRLMNTSTLRDLCYVFIYAIQKRNAGLACRVFMLLVEDYKRPANRRLHGYLSIIINRMAVNKLHQSCENRCLSRARLQLSHSDLVRELRAAVASGISYFPPLDPDGAQQDCTCKQRAEYPLKEEMCRLLETGYRRHEQPYLFAFAVLAEELDTGSSVERLRTLNYDKRFDVELMLLSKTSFGRSFFDILIEGALTDMQRMQVFLSERLYTKERPRDHDNGLFGLLGKSDETEHIRLQRQLDNTLTFLGAVQAAATHGIEAIENTLAHCLETGGSVPLHKATITPLFGKILLRNRWPTSICEGIVRVFFGESLIPGYEEASETVLSRAVHSNSWELAASLIDILPVSTDEREAVGDFSYIKHALRCRDCRGIAMQMPGPRKKWSFDLRTNSAIWGGQNVADVSSMVFSVPAIGMGSFSALNSTPRTSGSAQIHSLSSNTECPQGLEEWFVIIKEKMLPREAMVLYVSSFIFKACQVQARIFKILSSCDCDAARIAFYDIVASIRDARQELRAFAESPRTAIGLFDTYMSNLYAGTCIKVYSLLMALACFLSHQRPLSIPLDVLRSTRNQCINIAQNSAQNVLDTLPRALNTRATPDMSPKAFFDAVKLVWPLRAIHAMPATSPEQKRVAAKTLEFLGRDIGLKQALNIYSDFYEPLPVEARSILEVDGDPLDELERLMS
ncbi:heterokaryon incompatibility protein het-E-1 [Fusarium circinatum]|uniref:Heterokaryon incompatibility protein het-E-1 n=1 Tax=Fusarium circinatum TaxID=48490 RepID=A0A8H5SU71_FUSCI|nr:heterokaryon incompatibility protein het-E-1 [Fusarium circinatum]